GPGRTPDAYDRAPEFWPAPPSTVQSCPGARRGGISGRGKGQSICRDGELLARACRPVLVPRVPASAVEAAAFPPSPGQSDAPPGVAVIRGPLFPLPATQACGHYRLPCQFAP